MGPIMEERIQRPAAAFKNHSIAHESATSMLGRRFESPTIVEISLCCEISAYAPDGDDRPLF